MKGLVVMISLALILGSYFLNQWRLSVVKEMDEFSIDFSQVPGKKIVVTGANQGLGLETVKSLAKAKGNVILACRNIEKCENAKNLVLSEVPDAKLTCLELDTSLFSSVRVFVKNYLSLFNSIDILINNAGVSLPDHSLTSEGNELVMSTNHLGHFLLSSLLFPHFNKNGRIVNVSSFIHYMQSSSVDVFLSNILSEGGYLMGPTYARTKVANLLFTNEFNRRVWQSPEKNPNNVISIAVHPGLTCTNMQRDKFVFWEQTNNHVAMKLSHGALPQISGLIYLFLRGFSNLTVTLFLAAVDPKVNASYHNYYGPEYVLFGKPVVSRTSAISQNEELQRKFWEVSKRLTDNDFNNL
jgi:NAD(P)-dependent dehydrogenase (short-subunit alcohol dehydrogenase family)